MNPATLPPWLLAVLIALFVIAPSTAHYLGPEHTETDALQLSAEIDNNLAAEFAAMKGP